MSIEKEKNKGFTLIELIIAIAMLAFLMTAVSSFMSSGIISYKKAKADIRVNNAAQENYDKISDAIMEAKDVYLCGYENGDESKLYWYVRDEEQKDTLQNELKLDSSFGIDGLSTDNVKLFSDLSDTTNIYIKALIIDTSTPIVESNLTKAIGVSSEFSSALVPSSTTSIAIYQAQHEVAKADGSTEADGTPKTEMKSVKYEDDDPVYNVTDTVRQVFLFNDCNMYYMTKYAYGTKADDNPVSTASAAGTAAPKVDVTADDMSTAETILEPYMYSSSFEVLDSGTTKITNCVACVDAANDSISVEMVYSDKDMTYTTDGMIRTRNSYVIKARKDAGVTSTEADGTDTETDETNTEGGEE